MYKTALGAFEQIDTNLLRVARTLGATEVAIFWRISLPLALPGIVAATTLAFARALGEFGATLMLAGNIPGQTQTIPMAIYFAVEAGAMDEAWFWAIAFEKISDPWTLEPQSPHHSVPTPAVIIPLPRLRLLLPNPS